MHTETQELMDTSKVSATFPQLGVPNVKRDNMIQTIIGLLQTDSEVVIVEGSDGIGKTTLLAQIINDYPDNTIGLFIRNSSRWAYDSMMLTHDLCDQIGWILKKEAYRSRHDNEGDADHLLQSRLTDLQRQANRTSTTYYFVVDGLCDIPDDGIQEREIILNLLPLGLPRFKFIFSGNMSFWKNQLTSVRGIRSFPLSGFTLEETREFFQGLLEDSKDLKTIHKLCKMVPGNLASIRRLLQAGTNVEQILLDFPDHLPDLIQLEWRAVEANDRILQQALAFLAFDKRRHSLASLSKLCKTEPQILAEKLGSCTFVEIQANGELVEFVCAAFEHLAERRLSALRSSVIDHAISNLLNSQNSPETLTHLPSLYHQAGRYDDLLKYLSPQHIGNLIECSRSWAPLHQQADLGVETALSLERDGELLRFGLQRATIASMESSEPWRSEIEAYLALDDFATANALAQQIVTREDRLHLLAVIAKARKAKSMPIDIELNDQIQQQYQLLDRSSLSDKGVEIASDLLYTHPELAIDLVQECMGKNGSDGQLDQALAQLSFNALMEKKSGMSDANSAQQTLRAKVKNPNAQKFMDTISLFFGEYTAQGVIAEIDKWEKATDRIFALRSWAVANAKNKDAAEVVEYALNTILKTTTYTANAKVYQELASPLVFIDDPARVKTIIDRLDGLKGTIQSVGPTVEFVKLQAIMAEAEVRFNSTTALERLHNLHLYIDEVTEPGTKLAAFAILARVLRKVDPEKRLEPQGGLHLAVVDGLKLVVEEILTKTADHYEAVRPAISALAQSNAKIALEVVTKLNTAPRREAALIKLVEAIADEPPAEANFAIINEALRNINTTTSRSEATYVILRAISRHKKDMALFLPKIVAYRSLANEIPDAELRYRSLCFLIETLTEHKATLDMTLFDSMLIELETTWNSLDYGWAKVDAGFNIVALLAKCLPEGSRKFMTETEKARDEIVLDCRDTAMTYIGCVRLTIRCFGGLLSRKLFTENDLLALKSLIDKIPSVATRVSAWSEVAMKFIVANDLKQCQDIVLHRLRPLIDSDEIKEKTVRWRVIASIAPVLYKAHNLTARQLLDTIPLPYRDEAYEGICSFYITKRAPTESYDHNTPSKNRITYEDFIDIHEIIQLIDADDAVYSQIESLVDGIQKKFKNDFTKSQVADILQKLEKLVTDKFPNPKYIKHDGFKILAEAQIARLGSLNNVWDSLATRARNIPNVADSAFVLMGIGAAMPSKKYSKALDLLREANKLIPLIAALEDRIDHYERLARLSFDIDKQLSKACLRQAWGETMPLETDKLPKARQRIIDFAHRLDPEFAASLASESDDDPVRELAREKTRERLKLLKMREDISSGEGEAIKPEQDVKRQVEIAHMMLTGLNSNRASSLRIETTRPFIKQASRMNAEDAYVVLSWVVANAVCRYSRTDQANTVIRPLFEASRLSAELAFRIAARIRSVTNSGISAARLEMASNDTLIRPGEREKALDFIRDWATNATGFIKITDPYFGVDELEVIKLIRDVNATIPISILTSKAHQTNTISGQQWEDAYCSHWRMKLSDSDAGEVKIVVIGKGSSGAHPIHDRWLLSESGGLRVGTSANSLGMGKLSEVSPLTTGECAAKLTEVDGYLCGNTRCDGQDRLTYQSFWL